MMEGHRDPITELMRVSIPMERNIGLDCEQISYEPAWKDCWRHLCLALGESFTLWTVEFPRELVDFWSRRKVGVVSYPDVRELVLNDGVKISSMSYCHSAQSVYFRSIYFHKSSISPIVGEPSL